MPGPALDWCSRWSRPSSTAGSLARMSEQSGWAEDPSQPPHLLLSIPLSTLRPESITPATANGREVVVFAGTDEVSLPVRFVDLDSGAQLPDRSLLHSAYLVGLGRGSGRTL